LIGSRRIGDIEARDLLLMIRELKRQKKDDGSPRHADGSIVNILGVCSSVFELAILEGAIEHNPVKHIPSRKRPKKQGKGGVPYRHHEAVALMTDPRIPADRRVLHTLQALTGMRIGEACGRRWRDYALETPKLGAIHVWSQYDDQPLKTGRAVHEKERFVPVHPVLAKALAQWRLRGFAELYGRPPSDDDFIVPDPATMGARTRSKSGKDHRGDVEALGIYRPGRLTHGLRRWFISACRNASARTEVVELMTHNAKGEVIDAYTSWEWSTLCDEITKLEIDLHSANLVVLPLAKRETPETAPVSEQIFASDFATRDQSEMIPSAYQWRRWESNRLQNALVRTIQQQLRGKVSMR
jgi:integrase